MKQPLLILMLKTRKPRMSVSPRLGRDRVLDVLLAASPFASTLGLAGLFVTIALGFEEPNTVMLVASTCLLLAAPSAVLIHAALTSYLTRARRRTWLRAIAGRKAISTMARYLQHWQH